VRHLYGTALAVGMTLVMFFGGAWGYLRLLKLPVPPGQANALPEGGGSLLSNSTALLALAVLVVTAVLAGLLAVIPRISPLASGLPGLLLLAWTGLYLANVRQAVTLIPLRSHAFGAGWEALLFNGVLGALGAVMVFPLFIPSRWRRPRKPEATEADAPTREGDGHLDVDDYLRQVTGDGNAQQNPDDQDVDDQPLVGTVLPRRGAPLPRRGDANLVDTNLVDTTRIAGASRTLRNTGSLHVPTSSMSPATGSMPRVPGGYRRYLDDNGSTRP
jgi:hypothetical protein